MRRKVLQDYVNVFCQMFVGWRAYDDIETLGKLGGGKLQIDFKNSKTVFNNVPIASLSIQEEIKAWFNEKCISNEIDMSSIETASLFVDYEVHNKKIKNPGAFHFEWNCRAIIKTDEKEYSSKLSEVQVWKRETPN